MRTAPTARPGDPGGLTLFKEGFHAYNQTGATTVIGTVAAMSFLAADDASIGDTNEDGGADSAFANMIAIADTIGADTVGVNYQAAGISAVALEAVTDGTECEWFFKGTGTVAVDGSGTNVAAGDYLIIDGGNAGSLLALGAGTSTQEYKIVGIALEAATTDTTIRVLFDGINGFGFKTA